MLSKASGLIVERTTIPQSRHDIVPLSFLNLVIQSAFIPNTKILSCLLIARAGLGKTIKLEQLRKIKYVYYTVDITPKHLIQFFEKLNRQEKKFLVIPDYITTLGHSKKTKDLFRGHLRAMMEEGVKDSDAYGVEYHFPKILKGSFISAITPEYFAGSSRMWKADGFLSRLLPFSYSHSAETRELILNNIRDKVNSVGDYKMTLITRGAKEPSRSNEMDLYLRNLAYQIIDSKEEPPYRAYQQMVALGNSSAVLRGSNKIEKQDIDLLNMMITFINRKETAI